MIRKWINQILNYLYPQKINNKLTVSTKTKIDINKLINSFGGIKNIVSVDAKINVLVCQLKNIKLVNLILIKELNIKGVLMDAKSIKLILGDDSQKVAELMKNKFTN